MAVFRDCFSGNECTVHTHAYALLAAVKLLSLLYSGVVVVERPVFAHARGVYWYGTTTIYWCDDYRAYYEIILGVRVYYIIALARGSAAGHA